MKIAIVAAGFEPAEADGLRRAMATFRHSGTIHITATALSAAWWRAAMTKILHPVFSADRRVRRIWLSRIARRLVRVAGLRLGVAQTPLPGGVCLCAFEQPAHGLLRPGADRPRCPRPRRRRACRRCQPQRLGLHPRAAGGGSPPPDVRTHASRRAQKGAPQHEVYEAPISPYPEEGRSPVSKEEGGSEEEAPKIAMRLGLRQIKGFKEDDADRLVRNAGPAIATSTTCGGARGSAPVPWRSWPRPMLLPPWD